MTSGGDPAGWPGSDGVGFGHAREPNVGQFPTGRVIPPQLPWGQMPASAPPAAMPPASAPPLVYQYLPYPPPYAPWPAPPPPVRRPAGAGHYAVVTLSVILALLVLVGLGLYGYADYSGALEENASWRPGATPTGSPPAQNAPVTEWNTYAKRSVEEAVKSQADALLAADEAGYLAVVDPGSTKLMAEQKRRFTMLRAMGPGVWAQSIVGGSLRSRSSRSWTASIKVSYCFGDPECRSVQLVADSEWAFKRDRILMTKLKESGSNHNGPRPWETDDLVIRTTSRVVMGATKANASRLNEAAVRIADRAAAVADKLSKWESPPSRYLIFLAGAGEWNTWYGHDQPVWAAAWAVPVGGTVTEVVVRTQVVEQSEMLTLLTHELTHVTTLAGKRDGAGRSAWWLIEGIAEYATLIGKPARNFDALEPTRTFVRGAWNGDPAVDPPTEKSSLEQAAARYGVAFLAVRRIADRHGQEKMLDFFGRVVHDDESFDKAARGALGASWASVRADCARFIRSTVG